MNQITQDQSTKQDYDSGNQKMGGKKLPLCTLKHSNLKHSIVLTNLFCEAKAMGGVPYIKTGVNILYNFSWLSLKVKVENTCKALNAKLF